MLLSIQRINGFLRDFESGYNVFLKKQWGVFYFNLKPSYCNKAWM